MAKHGRKSGEGAEPPPVIEIPGKEEKKAEEPAKGAEFYRYKGNFRGYTT